MVGSSWPAEEEAMAQYMKSAKGVKLVLVPHEIDAAHIAALEQLFPQAARYTAGVVSEASVLIVDTVGLLSRAYRYCDVAVIGGGFGKGIHNILEAAVYGKPVVFGPRHQKFHEAAGLLSAGGAFSADSPQRLVEVVKELVGGEEKRRKSGASARDYVLSNTGATQKIMSYLIESEIIVSK
jgi:3-deoxy-D-manno-octulosonic-acid transferase